MNRLGPVSNEPASDVCAYSYTVKCLPSVLFYQDEHCGRHLELDLFSR